MPLPKDTKAAATLRYLQLQVHVLTSLPQYDEATVDELLKPLPDRDIASNVEVRGLHMILIVTHIHTAVVVQLVVAEVLSRWVALRSTSQPQYRIQKPGVDCLHVELLAGK